MLSPLLRRSFTSSARRLASAEKPSSHDFRKPWVYRSVGLLSNLLIPGVFLYAIFVYDFGQDDHVFLAPRRWAERKREEFFTISDEDRKLIGKLQDDANSNPPPTTREQSAEK